MSVTHALCPQCSKDDMIQKVSAIYSGGMTSGSFSGPTGGIAAPIGSGKPTLVGGYTTLHGVSQTALSKKLAPPPSPQEPGAFSRHDAAYDIMPTGTKTLCWVVILGLFGLSFLASGLIDQGRSSSMCTVPIAGILGLIVYLVLRDPYAKEAHRRFQLDQLAPWEAAMEKWSQLYFCARDDIVFDPATGASAPSANMTQLLYDGLGRPTTR